jgi:hypothetical protein
MNVLKSININKINQRFYIDPTVKKKQKWNGKKDNKKKEKINHQNSVLDIFDVIRKIPTKMIITIPWKNIKWYYN